MKAVKDVSEITGVSIRTLRYYDEIGLLKPAGFTEGGYRLYDGQAIERLQEILLFRELEIPGICGRGDSEVLWGMKIPADPV